MKKIILLAVLASLLAPVALLAQAAGGPGSGALSWFHDHLGMEMGSVTMDGESYSKVVLAPELKMGRVKLGLYLPVIYKNDLFDPSSWYRPSGNNEWDFGAQYWETDTVSALMDVAADLILKVKYLEYGQPLEDPFFFKIGNLHDLTIGHGLIMRNYRNDGDFPSVRRTGVNTGFDFGGFGFEAFANDLPVPDIVGARLYVRPIKNFALAFGVSGVADMAAGKDLAESSNPLWKKVADKFAFLGGGVDLDLPIIKSTEMLGLRAFADAAVTVPYILEDFVSPLDGTTTISSGLKTDLIWDGEPRNWGPAAGLLGNVLYIDWRLEYRYFNGLFRPAFFDSTYERGRSANVQRYIGYLENPGSVSSAPTIMGIYGEAGFSLIKDKLTLLAGYMWPWDPDAGFALSAVADDEFHAGLVIRKGLIPVVALAGAVYYDKRGLVSSLADGSFVFFDDKTAFAGEIEIPIPSTPNLAIGLIFKAVAERNSSGGVVYVDDTDPSKGIRMAPSITIETRFRF